MKVLVYTKEELVEALNSGEKLVTASYNNYDKSFSYREVGVKKVTEKSVMVSGGGYARRSFSEIGEVNYRSFYCLEKDAEKGIENYRNSLIREQEMRRDTAQQMLDEYKSAKFKGRA